MALQRSRRSAALVPLILTLACQGDNPTEPPEARLGAGGVAAVLTDQLVYSARPGAFYLGDGTLLERHLDLSIGLRYVNSSRRTIYLPGCNGTPYSPILQVKRGDEWVVAYAAAQLLMLCASPQISIEPGRSYNYIFDIRGYVPGGSHAVAPGFDAELPGTFRVFWPASERLPWPAAGSYRQLPEAEQLSNEFQVVESPT
jgi:hypothetical protein